MNEERWNNLMPLLEGALALPASERKAYVEEVCKGDPAKMQELLSLLQATEEADAVKFFDRLGEQTNPLHARAKDFRPGKTYGQYVIKRELGRGGMGIVYLAFDQRLQRSVALKFLPDHLLQNQEDRLRFINEARAAAALNHPNICTIYEIQDDPTAPFIAMAHVAGRSLKEIIAATLLDIPEALRLAIQICEGLDAAHTQNIIHRDIKPSNLMVDERGRLIIMDFGLAKLPDTEDLSKSGTTRGTVSYMSPEQARGREVDPRSDLWSLGVVMYEMLAGQRPFQYKNEYDLIQAIIKEAQVPIENHRRGVPRELRNLINRLLAKKPRDRFLSANDVLQELRTIDSRLRLRKEITRSAKELPSIAVLPFVNMSSDPENEFFCDGLAEELINGLCNLSELRVAARTSAFAFKGKNLDIKTIGRQLQVEHVLEGSVRKDGNRVRITVQLIKIEDGYHLWSKRYDKVLEDVFEVQEELTLNIVNTLKVKLLGTEKEQLLRHTTSNYAAYSAYLKSRFHWNRRTQQDLEQAINFARESIHLDPDFANAYSCLADSHVLSGLYGYLPGKEVFPRAKEAAEKAISLNVRLPEAYTSLGVTRVFCDWDWDGAERACRKAIALNPAYPTGHSFFAGFVLAAQGRLDEAINEITIAEHNDPLSFIIHTAAGIINWQAGYHEKAFSYATRVIENNPRFWLAFALRGLVYEQWEQYDEAIKSFHKADELAGSRSSTLGMGMLGHGYARSGQIEKARSILNILDTTTPHRYTSPYDKAVIYTGLGEYEQSLAWLEQSVAEKSSWTVLINVDPRFNKLKSLPDFANIKASMSL